MDRVIRTLPWEGPRQVNITNRIDTSEGKRYCPIVGDTGGPSQDSTYGTVICSEDCELSLRDGIKCFAY